ncbi:hypothetical protein [Mesorhizobium sp. M0058]|uniref:hypothetical protein n=1 Tax=Mesorhizobium sp. M0058 TaxID=2956865 RepID=UPI003339793D
MTDRPTLSDDETADMLHRMAFELETSHGTTRRADAALKAARAALLMFLAGLLQASEAKPPQPPDHPAA